MLKKVAIGIMLLAATTFATVAGAADDPSLHQVNQAAEAGKFNEAQAMMDQVLRDHPNSGKAHFVEAELLAKQGRLANAQAELSTAERLSPGLSFAKPQAVQNLKNILARPHQTVTNPVSVANSAQGPATSGGLPWGLIILGAGALLAIIFFARSRNSGNVILPPAGGSGYAPGSPIPSYGPGGMGMPMGQAGSGIGSGIMGGLATGAALGAGMVAGEALMHHFTDGDRRDANYVPPVDNTWNAGQDDMGGTDFGISDNSSWDDAGSGGGGDDWS